jgi:raffinose/stachyose/melibiose transport system substrate-binding protein
VKNQYFLIFLRQHIKRIQFLGGFSMLKRCSLCLILVILLSICLTGCKNDSEVYFLNFKPEAAKVYEKIVKEYEKESGVKVKVATAAANTYEQTLKSEIAKSSAPTIFQVNGPIGYEAWKEYCLDIKDSGIYSHLSDKTLAITEGEGVYAVPYVVEGYGIIYNDAIMRKYFSLKDKAVDISSAIEITSFDTLKAVVEDMTAKRDALGIKGVFASTSLSSGEDWRWQTHLLNVPLYYEFRDSEEYSDPTLAGLNSKNIAFRYSDNYKNLFDLYINNSITEKTLLGSKSTADSMAEFALGQVAMVQNGNWAWSQISGVEGNTVKEEDIKFMPLYIGVDGEKSQGLCIGTENYIAINKYASEDQQKKSLDFLNWLFTSETGKRYVTNELDYITPFDTFKEDELPRDPLAREVVRYMNDASVTTVPWIFTSFPSDVFKAEVGGALLEYVQGGKDWKAVDQTIKDKWKSERA